MYLVTPAEIGEKFTISEGSWRSGKGGRMYLVTPAQIGEIFKEGVT